MQFTASSIEAPIPQVHAIIFDFDGLLIDSESASRQAWEEEYARHGLTLDEGRWRESIGTTGGFDPVAELANSLGDGFDRVATTARRHGRWIELTRAAGLRPGVAALVDEAVNVGLRLAIASSSRRDWVLGHLTHAGLRDPFEVVVGRDDVGDQPKPAPAVYLEALRRLDVSADQVVALEDSQHGVAAATAAGVPVVAVPNPVTVDADFSAALHTLPSLKGVTLQELLSLSSPQAQH